MRRQWLALLIGLMLLTLAPNLVWLSRSTSRVANASNDTLHDVTVRVGATRVDIGTLDSGERAFVTLPISGEATYRIAYTADGTPVTSCQEYVEGGMYHVEAVLVGGEEDRCTVTLPLFSDLFVRKLLP